MPVAAATKTAFVAILSYIFGRLPVCGRLTAIFQGCIIDSVYYEASLYARADKAYFYIEKALETTLR